MEIIIEDAIIHAVDSERKLLIKSKKYLSLSEDIKNYLNQIIRNTLASDDIKLCTFEETPSMWDYCNNTSWNLLPISETIANQLFAFLTRNDDIPLGDLLFATIAVDCCKFLAMLKLDHKNAFTHYVQKQNQQTAVDIIRYKTILPASSAKVTEGFFIDMEKPSVKVVEQKYIVDGMKDFYLSSQILACSSKESMRQKTTKLLRTASQVASLYYPNSDEMDVHITSTMYDEFQKGKPLSVETLGRRFFHDNPIAQEEFFQALSSAEISRDDELSLSERFQKKFQKRAIRSTGGIEIRIPTQMFLNADEVEFINNPDGTISVLIKNISL